MKKPLEEYSRYLKNRINELENAIYGAKAQVDELRSALSIFETYYEERETK